MGYEKRIARGYFLFMPSFLDNCVGNHCFDSVIFVLINFVFELMKGRKIENVYFKDILG